MKAVVFQTPTMLPTDAFMVFGMSSKPNTTTPIGYFGTGLKYAIAVLLRERIDISIFIGTTEYVFYLKDTDFRENHFQQVMLKKRKGFLSRWSYQSLPFTTQLGRNWQLWQALRELQSNTLDEKGSSFISTYDPQEDCMTGLPSDLTTTIIVRGDRFCDEYDRIGNVFLPKAKTSAASWSADEIVEILPGRSKHIYFRGLRVYDLPDNQTTLRTYNVLTPITLTEDRTVKNMYELYIAITNQLVSVDDPTLIREMINAGSDTFESKIDMSWANRSPKPIFVSTLQSVAPTNPRFSRFLPTTITKSSWESDLIEAIRGDDINVGWDLVQRYKDDVIRKLEGDVPF